MRWISSAAIVILLSLVPAAHGVLAAAGPGRAYALGTVLMLVLAALVPAIWPRSVDRPTSKPNAFLAAPVAMAGIALLYWVSLRMLPAVFAGPLDPNRGDMLVIIEHAIAQFLARGNPYAIHHVPWDAPLSYGPVLWLPFVVPYTLAIDLRIVTLAAQLVVPACLVAAASLRAGRGDMARAAALACLAAALALNPDLLRFHPIGHTQIYWPLLLVFAASLAGRRWIAAAICLGLLVAARTTMIALVPVFFLHLWSERVLTPRHFLAFALAAALPFVPFVAADPGSVYYAMFGVYLKVMKGFVWYSTTWTQNTYGITGRLLERGLERYVEITQVAALVVTYGLSWRSLRHGGRPEPWMAVALLVFSMTTLWPVGYLYFDVWILLASGLLAYDGFATLTERQVVRRVTAIAAACLALVLTAAMAVTRCAACFSAQLRPADYAPTFAPDGKSLVYLARISGNEKLFSLNLETRKKTQLTFGTHDEGQAKYVDGTTLVFPSTAVNPTQPIEPEVARNGNIFNIWTLNLVTGELRQYTDAASGNVSPVLLNDEKTPRVAFVTYYKTEWDVHTLERKEPIQTAMSSDFGEAGPALADFQAPMTHTLVEENKKRKGTFEKMFLEGRPPVALGVTSGGDLFGGTQVTFSDVLGDKQFSIFASSVSQYRTFSGNYTNLSRRFQYAIQGFSQEEFFYGTGSYFYDPVYNPIFNDRDNALATRTMRGGSIFGIYPFDRYRRIELFGSVVNYNERYNDPTLEEYSEQYQLDTYGQVFFRDGMTSPVGLAFVQETTVFREFGPLSGNTLRLSYEIAPKVSDWLSYQTVDADARKYIRLGGSGLLALRGKVYHSWGDAPGFQYFGGNSELRGYEPGVCRQHDVLRERRAPLPGDRSHADAARRDGRRARRLLCGRRRCVRHRSALHVHDEPERVVHPLSRLGRGPADRRTDSDFRTSGRDQRPAAPGRPRIGTGSVSRPSRSASPSTSTGPGGHC